MSQTDPLVRRSDGGSMPPTESRPRRSDERCASCGSRLDEAVEDQRAMAQVRNAVQSLRAGSISTMSAWQAVVDAADRHVWERR